MTLSINICICLTGNESGRPDYCDKKRLGEYQLGCDGFVVLVVCHVLKWRSRNYLGVMDAHECSFLYDTHHTGVSRSSQSSLTRLWLHSCETIGWQGRLRFHLTRGCLFHINVKLERILLWASLHIGLFSNVIAKMPKAFWCLMCDIYKSRLQCIGHQVIVCTVNESRNSVWSTKILCVHKISFLHCDSLEICHFLFKHTF